MLQEDKNILRLVGKDHDGGFYLLFFFYRGIVRVKGSSTEASGTMSPKKKQSSLTIISKSGLSMWDHESEYRK